MELSTKASGIIIFITEEESCITLAEISTKANSLKTWLKVLAFTNMRMEANTWGTGTRTSSTVLGKRDGTMEACTKAFTSLQTKKGRESTSGQMETGTLASGPTICLMAEVCSCGTTTASIWETGEKI